MYANQEPAILKLYKESSKWQVKFITLKEEKSLEIKRLGPSNDSNSNNPSFVNTQVADSYRASDRYKDNTKLNKIFMGAGYRAEWSEKIKADHLNLDNLDGGSAPYSLGGGLQTTSLKLKAENKKSYAFRLLDKRPEKSLSDLAKESYYKTIVVELITTMHPYGPLVANHLLDQTDILHLTPQLFVLSDNPQLVDEYSIFVGKLGTLEEKPKGKKKDRPGFYGADDVVSTYEMMTQLRNSELNSLDKIAFAKARLMDMYLGDWDRHEDNWKWAVYKDGKNQIYKPIPKDRDHVFSKWSGIIPSIADMTVNNAEDFDYKYGNIRHLNFKARFLDRELGSELSLDDWQYAADYLKNAISDNAISEAVDKIPIEAREYHAKELREKLKSRRDNLAQLAIDYYKELNPYVDIVGTNRKDRFTVKTIDNNTLSVSIFHENNKTPYFNRKLETDLIDEVYLYGLGEKDDFVFDLDKKTNCKFHLIGGDGTDIVTYSAPDKVADVILYDSDKKDSISHDSHVKIKSPSRHAYYDPEAFDYNWLIPNVWLKRSSGNGTGFLLGASYLVRGFNKPTFSSKFYGQVIYYPSIRANRYKVNYTKRHVYKLWDFKIEGVYSSLYDKFPFFYGIGNNTVFNRELRFAENRIDYNIVHIKAGLEQNILEKSEIGLYFGYENHDVTNFEDNQVFDTPVLGQGSLNYYNVESKLELDFTDNSTYPTDGSQFYFDFNSRYSEENNITSNLSTRFTYYKSAHLGLLVTFAGGVSYMRSFGNSSFYHLAKLGSSTNFRGYTRNRFLDQNAIVFNKELRVRLGTIKTPLVRFIVGVHGLWDHGRVWGTEESFNDGGFKDSYGGGFFFAPGNENFTISYYLIRNEDENDLYTKIQLGFDF